MERIGERREFNNEERQRLQTVFTEGKLSEDICWLGWTEYKDNNGKTRYTSSFSGEVLELMFQMCRERIEKRKQQCEKLYNDFSLQKCADIVNEEINFWRTCDARSIEWQRTKKHALYSVSGVENGKCNFEGNSPTYECIIIRERNFYSGMIKVSKTENGYWVECRAPLAGGRRYKTPKDEIYKSLKEETRYILG